ncbi:MAG: hypothetical protein LAQ30_07965 [Acidobacteriia bacterium]|nr:hypothetical protein [Terriglobia bacterium]
MAYAIRRFAPFAALTLLSAAVFAAEPVNLNIDVHSVVVAPFIGAGVQWDPYEYPPSPEAWKTTVARMDFMRPAFVRVMTGANYCLGFDETGNPRYVWAQEGQAEQRLQWLFAILDYAQARKIDVMLGEWSPPRGLGGIAGPQDPRWARIIADFVHYLTTTKKYTVIKYYNLMNEPNGGWMWPGGKVDYDAWAAGIRNLRAQFDAHGLKGLPIAGPDNSGSWDWLDRCSLEFPDHFGAWEMHWYAKDSDILEGKIESLLREKNAVLRRNDPNSAAKPRFMGEAGLIEGKRNGDQQPRVKTFEYGVLMADYFAQVARAGWMGAIAWDLDDAMHAVSGRHRPNPPDDITLKIWGFWNTQGSAMGNPKDEAIRPWFYTWSLMSRLFPKGSRMVAVEGGGNVPGLRAMAATRPGGQLTVMIVNDSGEARSVLVRAPAAGRKQLVMYRYFDGERPADQEGYPVDSGTLRNADLKAGAKVELPSRGVVFLTE